MPAAHRETTTPVWITANGSTVTPGVPASRQAGDLLELWVYTRLITATMSTPSGWTLDSNFPKTSGTGSGGRVWRFLRKATADANDDPGALTVTGPATGNSGDIVGAHMSAYSDADVSDVANHSYRDQAATVTDASITSTITYPSITTASANALHVLAGFKIVDSSGSFSQSTNYTERADSFTTTRTGGGIDKQDRSIAAAGATGTVASTITTATGAGRSLAISVAIKSVQLTHTTTTWASSYTVRDRLQTTWASSYVAKDHVTTAWASSYTVRDHATTTWASSYVVRDRIQTTWQSSYQVAARVTATWTSSYVVSAHATTQWQSSYTARARHATTWASSYTVRARDQRTWATSYTTRARGSTSWQSSYTARARGSKQWATSYSVSAHVTTTWRSSYVVNTPGATHEARSWETSYLVRQREQPQWASTWITHARLTTTWTATYTVETVGPTHEQKTWEMSYTVRARQASTWATSYTVAVTPVDGAVRITFSERSSKLRVESTTIRYSGPERTLTHTEGNVTSTEES